MKRVRYNRRYLEGEADSNKVKSFVKLPRFLFDEEFRGLSNDARILYALLRSRHELSVMNEWFDEKDDVYHYYTRKEMTRALYLSENTVSKAMRALAEHGLLEEVRQGVNKPNRIYLLRTGDLQLGAEGAEAAENLEDTGNLKFCGSRTSKDEDSEPQILRSSYKDENYNDYDSERVRGSEEPKVPRARVHAPVNEYGEFGMVGLSDGEYARLEEEFGREKREDYIGRLDRHIASGGREYKSHYATLKKWIAEDERGGYGGVGGYGVGGGVGGGVRAADTARVKRSRFAESNKRDWDFDEIERMALEYAEREARPLAAK